ncbi:hypothetical protein SmJEL517_g03575 [Synchytrium microbalum]|uniref:Uncharacterized protein n=1 Tax=Synchytrium microbalum TaxID=1806994 RepID=A0A507C6D4_9FUNG|nr:uncharacterized protein SmJEL517_g03575 [Synchytrium microbalum]TPX33624.1 hypothetical protein SmJEL517_g03575 [Synchytrium microbalum]
MAVAVSLASLADFKLDSYELVPMRNVTFVIFLLAITSVFAAPAADSSNEQKDNKVVELKGEDVEKSFRPSRDDILFDGTEDAEDRDYYSQDGYYRVDFYGMDDFDGDYFDMDFDMDFDGSKFYDDDRYPGEVDYEDDFGYLKDPFEAHEGVHVKHITCPANHKVLYLTMVVDNLSELGGPDSKVVPNMRMHGTRLFGHHETILLRRCLDYYTLRLALVISSDVTQSTVCAKVVARHAQTLRKLSINSPVVLNPLPTHPIPNLEDLHLAQPQRTERSVPYLAHDDGIWAVAWSKTSNKIVTASVDDTLKIWNGDDVLQSHTLTGHMLGVISVDVNAAGTQAVSSALDGHIRIWDLQTGAAVRKIDAGPVEAWTVSISPDGRHIAAGSHQGKINVWSLETGAQLHENGFDSGTRKFALSVAYSPSGLFLASGSETGQVHVFDVPTQRIVHTHPGHSMSVRGISFSSDSKLFATASDDKKVNVFDVRHVNPIATFQGHTSWALSVAFDPNGMQLASGSSDKTVKIWSMDTKSCEHTFTEHTDQVWGVAYNEDGSKLATVSDDKTMIVYTTGNPID